MGPSALRLEARVIGADEGADVIGHVEELDTLLLVEGELSATLVYGSALSAASTRRMRQASARPAASPLRKNAFLLNADVVEVVHGPHGPCGIFLGVVIVETARPPTSA